MLEYQESIYPQVGHKYDDRMVISVMIVIDVSRNMVITVITVRSLQNLPSNYWNIKRLTVGPTLFLIRGLKSTSSQNCIRTRPKVTFISKQCPKKFVQNNREAKYFLER